MQSSILPEQDIKMHPADWFCAPWRDLPSLELPSARPFELQAALIELAQMPPDLSRWTTAWLSNRSPDLWNKCESSFWLTAMTTLMQALESGDSGKKALQTTIQSLSANFDPQTDVARLLQRAISTLGDYAIVPIVKLQEWQAITILAELGGNISAPALNIVFRRLILPYLSKDQKDEMRKLIASGLPGRNRWGSGNHSAPALLFLASALGMQEEVRPAVKSLPNNIYSSVDILYVFGLSQLLWGLDKSHLLSEFARLKLQLLSVDDMVAWIAHTEASEPAPLHKCILVSRSKAEAEEKLELFCRLNGESVAPYMVDLYLNSKAPAAALAWLRQNMEIAIPAVKLAEQKSTTAERASLLLNNLLGQLDTRTRAVSELSGGPPIWFAEELAKIRPTKRLKPPSWLQINEFRPVFLEGCKLSADQLVTVLSELKVSSRGEITSLVRKMRRVENATQWDWFSLELFERWLQAGAPPSDKWCMLSIGFLGSDKAVLSLIPQMLQWRQSGLVQRAMLGLECLKLRGSETALLKLNEIANTPELRSLQSKARQYVLDIALELNLSVEQLEDRLIPKHGFDSNARQFLSFGTREFEIGIKSGLKPFVKDSNAIRDSLPAPGSKDDPALAREAKHTWQRIKSDLKSFAKVQSARLERAMIDKRLWIASDFNAYFLAHPLMRTLARGILWCTVDELNGREILFRVTAESTLSTSNEREFQLQPNQHVRIAHVLFMTQEEIGIWQEIFLDYEITQPFEQLGRKTQILPTALKDATDLSPLAQQKVEAVALPTFLEKRGWWRAQPIDGYLYRHTRPFAGAKVTSIIEYSGIFAGSPHQSEDQEITRCYFVEKLLVGGDEVDKQTPMLLGAVDELAISEVLNDLAEMVARYAR